MAKKRKLNLIVFAATAAAVLLSTSGCGNSVLFSSKDRSRGRVEPTPPPVAPTPPPVVVRERTIRVEAKVKKVDVMIVTDDSVSMKEDNVELGRRIEGLTQILEEGGVDWQACYTTTDVQKTTMPGKFRTWKGTRLRVLNNRVPGFKGIFEDTFGSIDEVKGAGNEQAIAASGLAIKDAANQNCFRPGASLALLILSDEDEMSCGGRCKNGGDLPKKSWHHKLKKYTWGYKPLTKKNSPEQFLSDIKAKWPLKTFTAHGIIVKPGDLKCLFEQDKYSPAYYGVTYKSLITKTGGVLGDICASNYADQLKIMGHRIKDVIESVEFDCELASAAVKAVEPRQAVELLIDGNKVTFDPTLTEGTEITLQYTCK